MIPIIKPWMDEREVAAVSRPILAGWVTQGPEVAAFEQEFAAFVGATYAIAVANCTVALHMALRAVGVGSGDEVITVSHSFIATANSVRYCGAIPVFVDVDRQTCNIDPVLVSQAITPRTKAILVVHQVGMPCDLTQLVALAAQYGLQVVEDAACAVGSEIQWNGAWERIGKPHGTVACFSFHPRKLLSTGDGGMITTSDPVIAQCCRLWRQHCMSVPDTIRHHAHTVVFESYTDLGYNYRMTDIQAAIGREQLRRLPEVIARRRLQVERYRELLRVIPGLGLPYEPSWARSNWQSFCVRLPEGTDQVVVMQAMLDAGVSTRRGVMCAHLEPAYRDHEPWRCGRGSLECDCQSGQCFRLYESERAQAELLILPLFHQLTEDEQQTVVLALAAACQVQPIPLFG